MLKKVIIYSRHGLRYPLFNLDEMKKIVDLDKISWDFEEGVLTPKGEILEYKFGQYLRKYLKNLGLKIEKKEFYANSLKRTVLTANILANSIFPFENIKVGYKYDDLTTMEDCFNIKVTEKDINKEKLRLVDEKLKEKYAKLEEILDIEKGYIYNLKSNIILKDNVMFSAGSFKLATDLVDMFILKYYENFPLDKIFKSEDFKKDVNYLSEIKDVLLDTIFGDLEYIEKSIDHPYKLLKRYAQKDNDLAVIVGHDSNIATILACLNLSNLEFGNEFEKYPIDSKLVFKIYEDDTFDLDMIYYDIDSIRNISDNEPICKNLARKIKFI